MQKVKSILLPLLAAMIWGMGFVFQSKLSNSLGPFTMNAARSVIAAIVLYAALPLLRKTGIAGKSCTGSKKYIAGIVCGAALATASVLQQYGIELAGAGKSGFLTTLYVVLVPIFSMVFGRRPGIRIWILTGTFLVGMYLLCVKGESTSVAGDVSLIACAVFFAIHIILIDRLGGDVDPIELTAIQFATAAVLQTVIALIVEGFPGQALLDSAWLILYLGVMSSAVAFTLQTIAQHGSDPTLVTLMLCLESVFAALGGALFLGERMTVVEIIGCGLMFASSALAQVGGSK